jgi:hypothetical protein
MAALPGGILRVFDPSIIAAHPGALQFNSSVFELFAEWQQSTTRVRNLKPDFVARSSHITVSLLVWHLP